jgi:hypothetical protein
VRRLTRARVRALTRAAALAADALRMTHAPARTAPRLHRLVAAALAALLSLAPGGLAAGTRDYVLQWVPPAGAVDGYRVYLGAAPSLYRQVLDLGLVPVDVDGIGRATLTLDAGLDTYVALTAYNAAGESPRSNEIVVAASACDPSLCDDAQQCTADDCGPGGCTHTALPDGTFCSAAGSSYGMCFAGACQPAQCTEGSHCDDGKVCNGVEQCDLGGACAPGIPVSCGAPKQCSVPTCSNDRGGCVEVPRRNGTPCNDGRRWTSGDRCMRGVCVGTRIRD